MFTGMVILSFQTETPQYLQPVLFPSIRRPPETHKEAIDSRHPKHSSRCCGFRGDHFEINPKSYYCDIFVNLLVWPKPTGRA